MNWMIPVIRWAQAGFLLILNQLVMLASLLVVPNLLGLGLYPVFLPYPIVLIPGIRPGADAAV